MPLKLIRWLNKQRFLCFFFIKVSAMIAEFHPVALSWASSVALSERLKILQGWHDLTMRPIKFARMLFMAAAVSGSSIIWTWSFDFSWQRFRYVCAIFRFFTWMRKLVHWDLERDHRPWNGDPTHNLGDNFGVEIETFYERTSFGWNLLLLSSVSSFGGI